MSHNTPFVGGNITATTPPLIGTPRQQENLIGTHQMYLTKCRLIERMNNINTDMSQLHQTLFHLQQQQVKNNLILNRFGHDMYKWNPRNGIGLDYNDFMYEVYQVNDSVQGLNTQLRKDLEYVQHLQQTINRNNY